MITWKLWLSVPTVELWEAVALVVAIEPRCLEPSAHGWMAGPGRGPFFTPRSFPSEAKRADFDKALSFAERAANVAGPIHRRTGAAMGMSASTALVSLAEVVAYFVGVDWPGIPAPLLALVSAPDSTATGKAADACRQPKNDDEQAGNGAGEPVPDNPAVGAASDWKQVARPVTGKRWTPEAVEELRAYRDKNGATKAAELAGVSTARVRALLPRDKPQPKGYSPFNPHLK